MDDAKLRENDKTDKSFSFLSAVFDRVSSLCTHNALFLLIAKLLF